MEPTSWVPQAVDLTGSKGAYLVTKGISSASKASWWWLPVDGACAVQASILEVRQNLAESISQQFKVLWYSAFLFKLSMVFLFLRSTDQYRSCRNM